MFENPETMSLCHVLINDQLVGAKIRRIASIGLDQVEKEVLASE